MTRKSETPVVFVRDPKTGKSVAVQGVGAMKGRELSLRPGIDLTKPIAEQAANDRHS